MAASLSPRQRPALVERLRASAVSRSDRAQGSYRPCPSCPSASPGWRAGSSSSVSMRAAPLSRISRAVIVLPSASLGSDTLNRSTMNRVVCRAVSASDSARARSRSASLRASQAAAARPDVIAMPATDAVTSAISRRCRRCSLALLEVVEADPEHAGDQLEQRILLAVLVRSRVGGDRLGRRSSVSSPSGPMRKISSVGKHSCVGVRGILRRVRFAADDQAEDPVLAPETLEREDFFVDPARVRGLRRADHDLARRLFERPRQRLAEVGRRRELVAVAKHRREVCAGTGPKSVSVPTSRFGRR